MDKYEVAVRKDAKRLMVALGACFIAIIVMVFLTSLDLERWLWFVVGLLVFAFLMACSAIYKHSKCENLIDCYNIERSDKIEQGIEHVLYPCREFVTQPAKVRKVLNKSPFEPMGSSTETDILFSMGYDETKRGSDLRG